MSTHGHRFLNDLLRGSTADRVRHNVKIPVLMVRGLSAGREAWRWRVAQPRDRDELLLLVGAAVVLLLLVVVIKLAGEVARGRNAATSTSAILLALRDPANPSVRSARRGCVSAALDITALGSADGPRPHCASPSPAFCSPGDVAHRPVRLRRERRGAGSSTPCSSSSSSGRVPTSCRTCGTS